jgi:thiol-disulfide isomerase/thioredoxin
MESTPASRATDRPAVTAEIESEKPSEPAADATAATPANAESAGAPASEPAASASADEEFGIGDAAPSFEGLTGTDDKEHSLKEFADAKAVAVVFTCNHCPVAVAYEDRLVALQKDYADKGVQVVAINVNNIEADKLPAMKERAAAKGFNFPYLYDPSQKSARDYGATVTPHIFLLNGEKRLAYRGAIDDSQNESGVTKKHLRDAIDAVLAGTTPETADVKAVGCAIQYE